MSDRVNCPSRLAYPIRGWRVPAALINRVVRLAFPPLPRRRSLFDRWYRFCMETTTVCDGWPIMSHSRFTMAVLLSANHEPFLGSARSPTSSLRSSSRTSQPVSSVLRLPPFAASTSLWHSESTTTVRPPATDYPRFFPSSPFPRPNLKELSSPCFGIIRRIPCSRSFKKRSTALMFNRNGI